MEIVVFPSAAKNSGIAGFCASAYKTWHRVWEDAFRNQFDLPEKVIDPDEFSRQSFWVGAFDTGHCAALVGYRLVDLAPSSTCKDSWFNLIPDGILRATLAERGRRGILINNATVDFRYRGLTGRQLLYTLVLAGNALALRVGFDKMLSITNDSKGIDRICSTTGGTALRSEIHVYNVMATFFEFLPADVKKALASAPAHIIDVVKKNKKLIKEEDIYYEFRKPVVA
ncbi:hypothetical protein [Microbulbifer sp. SAOS-129_SWC]|uniref:hypothetical protein n=1 Tax=Microbulbifer sp. SAOS-129_SWC TaxID=3145235 RepID=UPI003216BF5B